MKLTIGLSYAPASNPKTARYTDALRRAAEAGDYDLELIDLYDAPERVDEVDGLLFTGGADIAPSRYGKADEANLCGDVDENRDRAEFELLDKAETNALPVLGICRGVQLINVHRGGTLITDIEKFGGAPHTKLDPETDSRHHVKVQPGTQLYRLLRSLNGEVNSAHHQSLERLGEGLAVSARDERDGTIESIEWADPAGKPYLLAVQWHPERMNYDEPFAGALFENFLWETAAHKLLRARLAKPSTPAREA